MPSEALKEAVVSLAAELGFDACRVARCAAPPHGAQFIEWLNAGHAGEMTWLERSRERRLEPQLVLPGARSVIVLAMNYWQGGTAKRQAGHGRVARYAWGEDYHRVLGERLRRIDELLQSHGGTQKCYIDTGPVLERDFAAEAGIGWHGKSTMLLHPQLGTWFFIAEILTTLDLAPDEPLPDRCGKCTRCIDACPTGAITAPHQLDARRCISYLTIELKGSIPIEMRPLIGDRIHGCDDCLDACPWNRFAQASRESAFAARQATTGMTLAEHLHLDDNAFSKLFRLSPIKRIRRRGFLRNVCVALGNIGSPGDLPALERAACDAEPLIAEHARWAIESIRWRFRTPRPEAPSV